MNYDFFGVFCDCPGSEIYKLDYNPMTHYRGITFETRTSRAHAPDWEACGLCEPDDDWTVRCDCCNQVCARAAAGTTRPRRPSACVDSARRHSPRQRSKRSDGRSMP